LAITSSPEIAKSAGTPKQVNLALQGGGSHGAFTWGVLERLMSDRRLYIAGLSGTSAGAMNAVVMADGFIKDRRNGAIAAIREFWERVAKTGLFNDRMMAAWKMMSGKDNLEGAPHFLMFDIITRLFSPYELNPMDYNPLLTIIEDLIDFEELRRHDELKLFVTATNVKTGKPRVFTTSEMTAQVLMASACLPLMFKAVEIDGDYYWDGGYMGNPMIYPLVHECESKDVLIIQINPLRRDDVPTSARDILNRLNELSFNTAIVREMRGFATITQLIESGELNNHHYAEVNFHMIEAQDDLAGFGASSKFNTDIVFLEDLRQRGWNAADRWLDKNYHHLGVQSSFDVWETFT
jgi:NTE family protein